MRISESIAFPVDPRWYQLVVLTSLLAYGVWRLAFPVDWQHIVVIMATALVAQYACTRAWRLPVFDPRSALISGLSLCLLLRTDVLALAALAALLAILSKFVIHIKRKHIFNPTNFALVMMLLISDRIWVSSGQWGSTTWLAMLVACCGGLVLYRTARSDITLVFIGAYASIILLRAWWLGDPVSIVMHTLQNGALLIFAFFMISDPKTIPDARLGRVIFGCWVAILAAYIQFILFQPNALLWALLCSAPLTPLFDVLFSAMRYRWPTMRRLI